MKAIIAATAVAATLACGTALAADDPVALTKEFKGDCLVCHAIDKKMVGPTWKAVANRYAGDASAQDKLTEKVIKGGKGNWDKETSGMVMPPHAAAPNKEQISKIVAAILALK